jgi:hypothetical protein
MTFNNNSDQKERRAILKNDAATLHQFAQSEANEISGRWAKPQTVNASEQAVHYPRVPSGPWSDQPGPGPEPSLGVSVEDHEPVGTAEEIEASLNADFGLVRSLSDGVPSATGGRIPAPPEPTPDAEATRATHPARQSLAVSGAGNKIDAIERPAPTHPRANLKRRLV